MKIVSKEKQDAQQHATLIGGLKGAAGGFAVSLPASYLLYRRYPYYRNLQPSLKAFGIILVVVPAFVISAEHAGQKFERDQWKDIGKMELDTERERQQAKWEAMSPGQKVSDFVRRHEYGVIVGSWAIAMTGAFSYIMRDPIQSVPQKLVQARVWAQGLTIGIVIAAGILTHTQRARMYEEEDEHRVRHLPVDHSWRDMLQPGQKDSGEGKSGGPLVRPPS